MEPIVCRRPQALVMRATFCLALALVVILWLSWESLCRTPEIWESFRSGGPVALGGVVVILFVLFLVPFLVWGVVAGSIRALRAPEVELTIDDEGISTPASGLIRWGDIEQVRYRWTINKVHAYADLFLSSESAYLLGLKGPKRWTAKARIALKMPTVPILITALDVSHQTIWQAIREKMTP